ncbi:glr2065 [Gloeobacter violaceus PCC 7421]|uniref:Glr2065 protein n=1 Tax=Gloeobacter violaceus (strain ATCC 29082 / PCC 7421) TaxID=251221 RepID=Q7NIW7_GLOVI|nr:glr2065 [Gloeobacter violaceus PCC 7421]
MQKPPANGPGAIRSKEFLGPGDAAPRKKQNQTGHRHQRPGPGTGTEAVEKQTGNSQHNTKAEELTRLARGWEKFTGRMLRRLYRSPLINAIGKRCEHETLEL